MKGDVSMMKVVNIFSGNEMGYVKGNTFYNKNGATKKFQNEWQMNNWLKSYGATIQKQSYRVNQFIY